MKNSIKTVCCILCGLGVVYGVYEGKNFYENYRQQQLSEVMSAQSDEFDVGQLANIA